MNKHIPTYALNNLATGEKKSPDVLFLSQPVSEVKEPLIIPHRTNYYGIGICTGGSAGLTANLENYEIIPGCLIAMSPHIIKQWHHRSADLVSFAVLFTKDFLAGEALVNRFSYFDSVARHIFLLTPEEADRVKSSLEFIQDKFKDGHKHRQEMLNAFIAGLLFEVAALYENYSISLASVQTRSQLLAAEFKKLVNLNFLQERSVSFYAERLFITTGHLTETVREVTGKTPGEWIAEAVVLEASVLLQNPALTVAQIADLLHFPDQSVFGKILQKS